MNMKTIVHEFNIQKTNTLPKYFAKLVGLTFLKIFVCTEKCFNVPICRCINFKVTLCGYWGDKIQNLLNYNRFVSERAELTCSKFR